jgi:type VI secretion system secreted protein Hcp
VGLIGAAIATAAAMAWTIPAEAATEECFLKIDGVTGDSAAARHRGEIELVNWSLGMTNQPGAVGASAVAGRRAPRLPVLRVSQRLDRAVPTLIQFGAAGQHVQSAASTAAVPAARPPTT